MKYYESYFEDYIQSVENYNIHPELEKIYDSYPQSIHKLESTIIYGASGVGKYSQMLYLLRKYSPSNLKYEKKLYIKSIKNEHIIKISDVHYEINMENLTCNSKQLFNDIYRNIIDCIETSNIKYGIILLKNFHNIDYELLDIFYSYIQKNINTNIIIKYIILTECISFIPNNILNAFKILYYSKLSFSNYIKISNIYFLIFC